MILVILRSHATAAITTSLQAQPLSIQSLVILLRCIIHDWTNWEKHFMWSKDYRMIVGLTAKGRATVQKLRLNRESVINLRRVLYLTVSILESN